MWSFSLGYLIECYHKFNGGLAGTKIQDGMNEYKRQTAKQYSLSTLANQTCKRTSNKTRIFRHTMNQSANWLTNGIANRLVNGRLFISSKIFSKFDFIFSHNANETFLNFFLKSAKYFPKYLQGFSMFLDNQFF